MNRLVALFVALCLAGCATATDIMQGAIGQPVQVAVARYGPPVRTFDMPDGRRAFQWSRTTSYSRPARAETTATVDYDPYGDTARGKATTTYTPAQTSSRTCLYTVYGRYDEAQKAWIIVGFEKPEFWCN